MTASKKMNKAQKQKLAAIQEKKALNRALKKLENKGAKFVRLTQAEEEAFYNYSCKEEASKQQNISKEKEEQQTTLTMRLPKDVANSLTEENILTALNNFVNDYKRTDVQQIKASDRQVAGTHYKTMGIQTWDVVDTWPIEQRIGYYRGNALKYTMRMGTKDQNAIEIAKGQHYIEKLLEVLKEANGGN